MNQLLPVPKNYQEQKCFINFDEFKTKTANLDDYLNDLKVIKTDRKGSTWGRCYIEVPPNVLFKFGITCNLPLVAYVNYVYNSPKFYCYEGEIFSGDAAWFDFYTELKSDDFVKNQSYLNLKKALENKSKDFTEHFDTHSKKWDIVPISNEILAEIAKKFNNHIK